MAEELDDLLSRLGATRCMSCKTPTKDIDLYRRNCTVVIDEFTLVPINIWELVCLDCYQNWK